MEGVEREIAGARRAAGGHAGEDPRRAGRRSTPRKAALEKAQREAAIIAARLVDAEDQQATITTTIAQDAEHADAMRAAIGQMAREAYKGGGGASRAST